MHFLPHYCLACERRFDGRMDLCHECFLALPWNLHGCSVCAEPLPTASEGLCERCLNDPPPFSAVYAPLLYQDAPRRWIQQLKFSNGFREGYVLAQLMCEHLHAHGFEADCLLPIPLSTRRLMWRGHNQALELARWLGKQLKIRVMPRGLRRLRHTAPQSDQPRSNRKANVRRAFACRADLSGLSIGLVDDVMTSGETLRAAAAVLLDAGAAQVSICVAARTAVD